MRAGGRGLEVDGRGLGDGDHGINCLSMKGAGYPREVKALVRLEV